MNKVFQAALAAAALCVAVSPAHAVIIGTADTSNSIPFGGTTGGYYYQQVYNAASFGGGLTIDQLTFYNKLYPGGTPRPGSFDVYLSTTNAAIASFDTNTSVSWLPSDAVQVFSGALPSLVSGRLDLLLSTAFNYNPAQGNLLLTIREFSLAGAGNSLYLDVDQNNGITNSRFSAYPYDWNQGLVTGFNIPEPATAALMLAGLGVFAARRRKAV